MRITEPQEPFLCPPCAGRLPASLCYCEAGSHGLVPECPDHHRPLRWTNGGLEAHCNEPTGYDPQGRRTWCRIRRNIIHYDDLGRPTPTREFQVRTIGQSVRRL